ncbi:MAG: GxxExxY protein [Candidatus Thermoplasmatota archaeon]
MDSQTYQLIGAAMKVHRTLGPGFLERAYHEALQREFETSRIPHQSQVPFTLRYDGGPLQAKYRADFVCYDRVVIELKAQHVVGRLERAQLENYLRCAEKPVGLLINFARRSLEYYRVVNPANRG